LAPKTLARGGAQETVMLTRIFPRSLADTPIRVIAAYASIRDRTPLSESDESKLQGYCDWLCVWSGSERADSTCIAAAECQMQIDTLDEALGLHAHKLRA
jgi:hypothetical protein